MKLSRWIVIKKLCTTDGEARRLITNGAIKLNGLIVDKDDHFSPMIGDMIQVGTGRRFKFLMLEDLI